MIKQMYLEMPLKAKNVKDFEELCNSSEGFAITKKQKGFVSAEWMISTSKDGSACFHLWEKWKAVQDFENYMQTPKRAAGSDFSRAVGQWADGDVRIFWGSVAKI
ncbi:hypothetical protein N8500_01855 [Candidatus Puniceispirillum sp.]|nr:hypothetical protein [Candidatus Puniceispirillum sp.]